MKNELFAQCPACKTQLRVVSGRKSTARTTTCAGCGARYDYSAWRLRFERSTSRTFYQVDLFPVEAK